MIFTREKTGVLLQEIRNVILYTKNERRFLFNR